MTLSTQTAEALAHEHRCRHCAAMFACSLPNRDCPTLCPSCTRDKDRESVAFWTWWEGPAGTAFVRKWSVMRSQDQLAARASAAFQAGWLACRDQPKE